MRIKKGRKDWDRLYNKRKGNCFVCRRLTHWVSLSFCGFYCFSQRCEKIWQKDLEICNSKLTDSVE